MSVRAITSAAAGSVAGLCETRKIMEDKKEHNIAKMLMMKPMWDGYGEE